MPSPGSDSAITFAAAGSSASHSGYLRDRLRDLRCTSRRMRSAIMAAPQWIASVATPVPRRGSADRCGPEHPLSGVMRPAMTEGAGRAVTGGDSFPTGAGSEADRRLNSQTAGPVRVFPVETRPFPAGSDPRAPVVSSCGAGVAAGAPPPGYAIIVCPFPPENGGKGHTIPPLAR